MLTHDPYMVKAIEYLVGLGSLVLFVLFWRYVNGEVQEAPARVAAWTGQLADWFRMPKELFYHPGHAWARPEGAGVLTIGMDDFSQQLVGQLAAVELPQPGAQIRQGSKGWTLKADSKAVDMLAPVTGTVLAVNAKLKDRADLVNEDPYGRGWLMKVQLPKAGTVEDLLSGAAARRWIARVSDELTSAMSPQLGTVLQDGGAPVHGIARSLDEEKWDEIASSFLHRTTADVAEPAERGAARISVVSILAIVLLVAAGAWTVSVAAQSLPKLPDALNMARSPDSPGQVVFNHASHVDTAKPTCTACHPREFRITKATAGRRPITHADMEKGRQCGKCHDGKSAFAMTDDCTMCHK